MAAMRAELWRHSARITGLPSEHQQWLTWQCLAKMSRDVELNVQERKCPSPRNICSWSAWT
jgi:hypothetical protein